MDNPKITYHVLNTDNIYTKQDSVYAGTYTGDEPLEVTLRIWNNFCGTEDIQDLENFNLVLKFLTEEDNALLKHIKIIADNDILDPILEDNAAIFTFTESHILRGYANTGSDQYNSNYINVVVLFDPGVNAYLKDHDLKSLVLDVVEL